MLDGDNTKTLWDSSKPLTAVGLLMIVVFVFSIVGMLVDPRVITGAPAWLKPAKFAISTAIYSLTLAWVFTYLPDWPRLKSTTGWITGVVFVLEVAIIDLQAARGTTSHFNIATPLDAALFGIMGVAILIVWLTSIAVTVALFRQQFSDRGMGWALRLGLAITVLGSATGGLMVRPTGVQLADAHATHRMPISAPIPSARSMAVREFRAPDGAWNTGICAFRISLGFTRCRSCLCSLGCLAGTVRGSSSRPAPDMRRFSYCCWRRLSRAGHSSQACCELREWASWLPVGLSRWRPRRVRGRFDASLP